MAYSHKLRHCCKERALITAFDAYSHENLCFHLYVWQDEHAFSDCKEKCSIPSTDRLFVLSVFARSVLYFCSAASLFLLSVFHCPCFWKSEDVAITEQYGWVNGNRFAIGCVDFKKMESSHCMFPTVS